MPQTLDVLQDAVARHHQVKQRLWTTHIAVPFALQDARQFFPSQVSEDAFLAESITTEVTTDKVASFSAPPA